MGHDNRKDLLEIGLLFLERKEPFREKESKVINKKGRI